MGSVSRVEGCFVFYLFLVWVLPVTLITTDTISILIHEMQDLQT
jgi:hypothetical protein